MNLKNILMYKSNIFGSIESWFSRLATHTGLFKLDIPYPLSQGQRLVPKKDKHGY